VEVFLSDSNSTGYGSGKTFIGFVTTDANGNFASTIPVPAGVSAAAGNPITGTATDASGNTSEFGANVNLADGSYTISGSVFEDVNYGGGPGRNKTTALANGGVGRSAATVELYSVTSGIASYVASTTTDASGNYAISGVNCITCAVRVVNASVTSLRTGYTGSLLPVLTYRTDATSGPPSDVLNWVGGTNPTSFDGAAGSNGASFNTTTGAFSTGTAQVFASTTWQGSNLPGADFGFNFDTVTNTNDAGAGSLRQVLMNANTLGGDASLAQAGRTAGIENVVFMMANGTTGAGGLRSSFNVFTGGVATITPLTVLPSVSATLVLDAQTQPGWSLAPVVEINGSLTSAGTTGLSVGSGAANSVVRGLVVNHFPANGIQLTATSGATVQGI
jgi:hypothetical protein